PPTGPRPPARPRPVLPPLVAVTAVAIFAQMLIGSWVTGQHAGLAFDDIPFMDGSALPTIAGETQAIHAVHRAMSLVVAVLAVWSALAIHRTTEAPLPRRRAPGPVALLGIKNTDR